MINNVQQVANLLIQRVPQYHSVNLNTTAQWIALLPNERRSLVLAETLTVGFLLGMQDR